MAERWENNAACRETEPELFFPVGTTDPKRATEAILNQVAEAKRICSGCRVARECLRTAIDNGYRHGIWGGLTEEERQAPVKRQDTVSASE